MPEICPGVEFDTIAREWRCKWSADNDKKSLEELQKALLAVIPTVSAVGGVKGVRRVVCGSCFDFKVITALPADKFPAWEEAKFEPEEEFLEAIKKIAGVSAVETQTYTTMPVKYTPPKKLKKPKMFQIGKINPDSAGFTCEAKVLEDPKEVEGKSKIFEVVVGDESGKVTCSLKDAQIEGVKKDKVLTFRNARILMVKGHVRLIVDKWGKIDASESEFEKIGEKDASATEYELVKS
jgi:replication factor A1